MGTITSGEVHSERAAMEVLASCSVALRPWKEA